MVTAVITKSSNVTLSSVSIAGINSIISFFTATMMEFLEFGTLADDQVRVILPTIFNGLKLKETVSVGNDHPCVQFRRCCFMIIVQVSRKSVLAGPLKEVLVNIFIHAFYNAVSADEIYDLDFQVSSEILISLLCVSQIHELPINRDSLALIV